MAMSRTARGPPSPPRELAAAPTAVREKSTRAGAFRAKPMAMAMAGPAMDLAKPPTSTRTGRFSWAPRVEMMVPTSREANRPWAMALMASTK
jgi:hypothetical protein